jgi:hypothetical protein
MFGLNQLLLVQQPGIGEVEIQSFVLATFVLALDIDIVNPDNAFGINISHRHGRLPSKDRLVFGKVGTRRIDEGKGIFIISTRPNITLPRRPFSTTSCNNPFELFDLLRVYLQETIS